MNVNLTPNRPRSSRRPTCVQWRRLALLPVFALTGCSVNPEDLAQVPTVKVTTRPALQFSWTPDGADLIRVYEGKTAGDGYGPTMVWSIASSTPNGLKSPVEYGTPPKGATEDWPVKELVGGQTYTVVVHRDDPKGTGEGFTNTSNVYKGEQNFVAP